MSSATRRSEVDVLRELRSSPELLERLRHSSGSELHVQRELRREFPDDLVRAALTLQELRRKAANKFSRADEMWFDRKGLEQSTSETIARHKARRFQGLVWDYCCGIGGEALALAERARVVAVDRTSAACLRTRWNTQVYGVDDAVQPVCMDVEQLADRRGLVHIDPDQRTKTGRRSRRVEDCVPGLEFLRRIAEEFPGGAIKLSPASNFAGKFAGVEYELVSLFGECKQAVVWFGALHSGEPWRATCLPGGDTLAGDPLQYRAEIGPLGAFVYDPDPAVVRAGLIDMLAERLSLQRLDAAEEYLTSAQPAHSPFAQAFAVEAELPNNEREIRRYFRAADIGLIEIKCRRIPINAEYVRRKLPLEGSRPAVLIFARIGGKARALICRRLASDH